MTGKKPLRTAFSDIFHQMTNGVLRGFSTTSSLVFPGLTDGLLPRNLNDLALPPAAAQVETAGEGHHSAIDGL